jgi:hypothetical protein
MSSIGMQLILVDHAILWIFIAEIVILITARGLAYFKDPWCVFDFVVVGIALIPASGSLSVLRALRVLRVLRLINKVESMRKVVGGLLGSLPGLGSVFGLILIIFDMIQCLIRCDARYTIYGKLQFRPCAPQRGQKFCTGFSDLKIFPRRT